MAVTIEDIQEVVSDVDLINQQIKNLEADRDAKLARIDVMDNERALSSSPDERDAETFRAEMLVLADEKVTTTRQNIKLSDWARTIDPAFAFRGWGIDNENDSLFPDFTVQVPQVITDDFVRNVNFFARITGPVQPSRLRISNHSFTMGYEGTFLKFSGDNSENAFTVCGSNRSGTSATKPLITVLRQLSQRAFSEQSSWLS